MAEGCDTYALGEAFYINPHKPGLEDLDDKNRAAVAGGDVRDLIAHEVDGIGTWWVHTHGAARFDVPDLELYGLSAGQTDAASAALRHVHDQLLTQGLRAALTS